MNKVLYYFGFIMALLYLAAGVLFIFTPALNHIIEKNREIIGGIFLAYGIFRIIIIIQKIRKSNHRNES